MKRNINKRWFYFAVLGGPVLWLYFMVKFDDIESFKAQNYLDNSSESSLWPEEKDCKSFDIHYGKNLKPQFLASFPRSGNCWTRYLIRTATGMNTDAYVDGIPSFDTFGQRESKTIQTFRGGGKTKSSFDGASIIIKTHKFFPKSKYKTYFYLDTVFNPTILLIRRPERSILSLWSFGTAPLGSEFEYEAPKDSLNTTKFHKFVKRNLDLWERENELFLKHTETLLIIFYEKLVKDPIKEVQKMVKFLGYKTDPQRLKCLQKNLEGPRKRKHTYEAYPYTSEEEELFSSAKMNIRDLIINRGFDVPDEFITNENPKSSGGILRSLK
ncbi:UNVERIFIED_CONTAM: hypothetical protein RMT77_013180 [Armadillidium vulgare]